MADLNFDCPHCGQNLTIDETQSGEQIDCPTCSKAIEIPSPGEQNAEVIKTQKKSWEQTEPDAKKYSVPIHEGQQEILVKSKKDNKAIEDESIEGDGRICAKTIKRGDCIELGQDKFDEALNEFLSKLKKEQILSVHPVNYAHYDPATQKYLDDYGAMVIYER